MPKPHEPAAGNRPAPDRPSPLRDAERTRRHQEDLLDEALAESFPASDPPSIGVDR